MSGHRIPWDVERIRKDFPILHQTVHGKPLVYLDSAATSQKPRAVIDAIEDYYTSDNANVHRGVHLLSERATEAYEGARARIRRFLNAAHSHEIVFVRGATEGINLVAQSYGRRAVGPGDEVVITALEHHSNIVPWQMLCEEKGAALRVVPIDDAGEVDVPAYERLLGDRTRLVAIAHVSNALGTIVPVKAMIEAAHRRSIPVLLDGAHNPAGARALAEAMVRLGLHDAPLVFGAMRDKRVAAVLRQLAPLRPRPVFTHVDDPHALASSALLRRWRRIAGDGGRIAEDPAGALELAADLRRAPDQPIVVAGSLYLVGAVRGMLLPERSDA